MANQALEPLLEKEPNRISYAVTKAEILTTQNEAGLAVKFLERYQTINPGNHPLTMAYADALVESRRYQEAADILEDHVRTRPEDYSIWYLIAEIQGQAGNISKVHQARAEYYVLVGDFRRAHQQLQFALNIETSKPGNGAGAATVQQRIRDIQAMEAELAG